jgi:hypothetical protein
MKQSPDSRLRLAGTTALQTSPFTDRLALEIPREIRGFFTIRKLHTYVNARLHGREWQMVIIYRRKTGAAPER